MEPDIAKVLSYEIRKELADRYFGFRKLIEEDKRHFFRQLKIESQNVEQKIVFDLARIYILLNAEDLIQEFLELAGLEETIYYDPYLLESPTIRQRVLAGIKARGFTRRRRFRNLVLDSYQLLVQDVEEYRERFGALQEDLETIKEEIQLFYRKNDFGNIMNFLRTLDAPAGSSASLFGGIESGATEDLERKLRVEPPGPLEQSLPVIPPLVPLAQVRKSLGRLAERAYLRQTETI